MKLNINIFLSCTECRHSCAIVCILVKLLCIFPIEILLEIAIYIVDSDSKFSSISTFSFFNFFSIVLHISILLGYLSAISFYSESSAIFSNSFTFIFIINDTVNIANIDITIIIIINSIFFISS